MATRNCSACADLQDYAPEFVLNGVTDTVSASLANDTGFNPNNSRNDCTDLNDASDCLIGNMDDEIEAYDVCDWKTYMHNFVPNAYNMFKSFASALCGVWTNIHSLWTQTNANTCAIQYLYNGKNFSIGEDPTEGSYVVAGKGVSFLEIESGNLSADINMRYIAGGLIIGSGSLTMHVANFEDAGSCYNFDDNSDTAKNSSHRLGNRLFDDPGTGRYVSGGELLYEIRLKKSQYPQIKTLYPGLGHETNGGAYRVVIYVFDGDATSDTEPVKYAFGQHGTCNKNGTPAATGHDSGHRVDKGWIFVQCRLSYVDIKFNYDSTAHYTPRYLMGVRMNQDHAEC